MAGVDVRAGLARGVPRRRFPARADRPLALADSRRGLRRLPVPEARALDLALLAGGGRRAPVGAWAAITNELPWQAWALGAAVAFWVAGFDLFYALFDLEVDRAQGLHSFPARFGVRAAFSAARICHAATVVALVVAGLGLSLGALYWLGVVAVAALLLYEHLVVSPQDRSRLDMAFFTMNGVISVTFFAFVLADVVL